MPILSQADIRRIIDEARARIDKLRALPNRSALSAAQRAELLAIEQKWTAILTEGSR